MKEPTFDCRKVLQALPGLYLIVAPNSPEFTILGATDAYLAATKTRREDITGRPLFEIFPDNPDDPDTTATANTRASLEYAIAQKVPNVMPVQRHDIRLPDGTGFQEQYWRPVNTPVVDQQGKVVYLIHQVELVAEQVQQHQKELDLQNFSAALRDTRLVAVNRMKEAIAAHQQTEQVNQQLRLQIAERKRAEKELRASEEKFRAMINAIPQLVMISNIQGDAVWFNEQWYHYTGSKSAGPGATNWQDYIKNSELGNVIATRQQCLSEGKPFEMEISIRGAQGEYHPFLTRVVPLKDSAGQVIQWFGTSTDVSRLKKTEKELVQHARELEMANKDLESFSYSISHDLRTPLLTIKGFTSMLQEEYVDQFDAQGHDYLNRIIDSSNKMSDLIDNMLVLSRLSRHELKSEEINLSDLVIPVVHSLRHAEPVRQVHVDMPGTLLVRGDSRLMSIALSNLLSNAWKFTRKMPSASIRLGQTIKDGEEVIYVRDNGVGIDMKDAAEIFHPFKRMHSEKEFSGTGIGLAIVKRVIEKHHGKIWIESQPNEGATFYFTLSPD